MDEKPTLAASINSLKMQKKAKKRQMLYTLEKSNPHL
jgi:hypothetical protein